MDILDDTAFVIEQLPKTQIKQKKEPSKREPVAPKTVETMGTTAMARAFRRAAKERKQEPEIPDGTEESGTSAMAQAFREAAIQRHEAEIEGVSGT